MEGLPWFFWPYVGGVVSSHAILAQLLLAECLQRSNFEPWQPNSPIRRQHEISNSLQCVTLIMSRTRISGSASLWVGWRVLRLSECRTLLLPCRTLVRTGYSTIRPGYCRSNSAHGFPAAQTHPTLALQAQLSPLQQLATQHRCPSVQQSWCPHSNPLVWTASRGASSTVSVQCKNARETMHARTCWLASSASCFM